MIGSERISNFPQENVWTEYTRLSIEYKSMNLGQGFPDWSTPQFIKDSTVDAVLNGSLSYARPAGDMELTTQVAQLYSPLLNRTIDPVKEILITNGASGAIFQIMQGLINPGDEVVILDPFFNQYEEWVLMASGKPIIVPLDTVSGTTTSNDRWRLNEDVLRKAITSKTKIIIINSPVNPTGKVFSRSELEKIAAIAIEKDLIVLSDEVYEFLCFGDLEHQRIATYPEMWKRTYTVSSSSKTFSVTGFKVGWIIAPAELIAHPFKVMQSSTFCVCTPLQKGLAYSLAKSKEYLQRLPLFFKNKCDTLCNVFDDVFGHDNVIRPSGGYFIIVNISKLKKLVTLQEGLEIDDQICRWLIKEIGVTSIPLSAFIRNKVDDGCQFARFCFAKKDETIDETIKRLAKLKLLL